MTERELVVRTCKHDELVWAIDPLVLIAASRVGARQTAQRQQPPYVTNFQVRLASPNKLIDLIEAGVVVPRLGRYQRECRF